MTTALVHSPLTDEFPVVRAVFVLPVVMVGARLGPRRHAVLVQGVGLGVAARRVNKPVHEREGTPGHPVPGSILVLVVAAEPEVNSCSKVQTVKCLVLPDSSETIWGYLVRY